MFYVIIISKIDMDNRYIPKHIYDNYVPSSIRNNNKRDDYYPSTRRRSYNKQGDNVSMADKTLSCDYYNKRRLILETPFSGKSIISYGLIVYARDTKKWAIIQRKHSVEFLLFIRGLYRVTYLPLLLSCITADEGLMIKQCIDGGPIVFKNIYTDVLHLHIDGLPYALTRMAESHKILSKMLPKLDLSVNQLNWTWPKGRLHISPARETPFECAKREFAEEVEIDLPQPSYVSDNYISEVIKTITGRTIESRYWIYIIPHEIPMVTPDSNPEVSDRMWADSDMCREKLRYSDLFEKIENIT